MTSVPFSPEGGWSLVVLAISAFWVEKFIILGAIILLTVAIMLWALIVRGKPRKRKHRHHHRHRPERAPVTKLTHRERRRHRRREHRPRNPTLAETGGLPPMRSDQPSGQPPPAQY